MIQTKHINIYVVGWATGLALLAWPSSARAEWTLNLGYHNPPDATVGLNLLYFGKEWAFELGVGWIDANTDKKTETDKDDKKKTSTTGGSAHAAGDANVKYLFSSGKIRPYLQVGVGVGMGVGVGTSEGFGLGAGGLFGGLGLMLGSPSVYGYGSYNSDKYGNTFAQGGLGVSF